MNFHLQFSMPAFPDKINYEQKIVFLGSCFAENIGERMQQYKFNVSINPHGVLYNPSAIANALRRYISNVPMKENELFHSNDAWNSWEHHSRFSHPDKENCLSEINKNISASHEFLNQTEWLFITFGSAFVYRLVSNGELVGNCHKYPQQEFSKELLNPADIVAEYKLLIHKLTQANPRLKIVFTVSPVRYIRDGVVENNLSKAVILQAVHELVKEYQQVFYFPAYELVIDDLRDYRFYKNDLVHPNEQAIDYVFEKLMQTAFDQNTMGLFEQMKEINTAVSHRPFNEQSDSHKKFRKGYFERCEKMQKEYPFLNLEKEMDFFRG